MGGIYSKSGGVDGEAFGTSEAQRGLGGSVGKNPSPNAGNAGLISVLGRSPGGGNGNPLWNTCLENPMERSLVGYSPRVTKNQTRLSTHAQTCRQRLKPAGGQMTLRGHCS